MRIYTNIINIRMFKKRNWTVKEICTIFDILIYNTMANYANSKAMLLNNIYGYVKVISNTIAYLSIELYKIDGYEYRLYYLYPLTNTKQIYHAGKPLNYHRYFVR